MQKYVDLAMRAHYDEAADQVVLHPVKSQHPDLAGMRVNLKRGTPSDDKLRTHLNAAGLLADELVPSGHTLDSWVNLPGISRSDVQLLKLLLRTGDSIAFVTAKGSAGYRLRSACVRWLRDELGKIAHITYAGTPTQLAAYHGSPVLPEGEVHALLNEASDLGGGYKPASARQATLQAFQVEGATLAQARWVGDYVSGQVLTALPESLSTPQRTPDDLEELDFKPGEPVLGKDGHYTDSFKALLNAYLQGAYGAIVYMARNAQGWVLEVDTELPTVKRHAARDDEEVAW